MGSNYNGSPYVRPDAATLAAQYAYNGYVMLSPDEKYEKFDLYKGSSGPQKIDTTIIDNIIEPTPVAKAFFCNENVEYIQNKIIEKVYNISNQRIGKQSYNELHIIMKSFFLQYGKNLPTNIQSQVIELDNMVIDECVRIVVPNVLQYINYIRDITSPLPVMPLPMNASLAGSKQYDFTSVIPRT